MTTIQQQEWNNRYQTTEYVYGTAPNAFFGNFLDNKDKKGKILLPAEGEGRNAVYAALSGWSVDAFDFSEMAQQKALSLANMNKVTINYFISDFQNVALTPAKYDVIALIYNHMKPEILLLMAEKYLKALKPEGFIIMEAFAKEQLKNTTGGPKILELLFDVSQISSAFSAFKIVSLEQKTIFIDEGRLHSGEAEVIRLVATK